MSRFEEVPSLTGRTGSGVGVVWDPRSRPYEDGVSGSIFRGTILVNEGVYKSRFFLG